MGPLVINSTRKFLKIRYELLPYLYTLFFRAHNFGETVARPLFFEFIDDRVTHDIDTQFLWGSALMIIPVLDQDSDEMEQVKAYIPIGEWYDFHTNKKIPLSEQFAVLKAHSNTIPLLIRGGFILPVQRAASTTTVSRNNNFGLLVALDKRETARGDLYWDDGDSLDSLQENQYRWLLFTVENDTLIGKSMRGIYRGLMILGRVKIMGLVKRVISRITLNYKEIRKDQFFYDKEKSFLRIQALNVNLREDFILSWTE